MIPGGAVTSIIGPDGCGKSTLLRALAQGEGRTVVMASHDLGQACRYADFLVA